MKVGSPQRLRLNAPAQVSSLPSRAASRTTRLGSRRDHLALVKRPDRGPDHTPQALNVRPWQTRLASSQTDRRGLRPVLDLLHQNRVRAKVGRRCGGNIERRLTLRRLIQRAHSVLRWILLRQKKVASGQRLGIRSVLTELRSGSVCTDACGPRPVLR